MNPFDEFRKRSSLHLEQEERDVRLKEQWRRERIEAADVERTWRENEKKEVEPLVMWQGHGSDPAYNQAVRKVNKELSETWHKFREDAGDVRPYLNFLDHFDVSDTGKVLFCAGKVQGFSPKKFQSQWEAEDRADELTAKYLCEPVFTWFTTDSIVTGADKQEILLKSGEINVRMEQYVRTDKRRNDEWRKSLEPFGIKSVRDYREYLAYGRVLGDSAYQG